MCSVLKSLVDGGLLGDQDTGGEDKVLQIEMDLPKYPGLVIQVCADILALRCGIIGKGNIQYRPDTIGFIVCKLKP